MPGADRFAPAASGSPATPSSPSPPALLPRAASPWPLRPPAWRWPGHLVPDGAGLLGHLVMLGCQDGGSVTPALGFGEAAPLLASQQYRFLEKPGAF